jgi:DnaJ-class molecular chaperone
MTHYLNGFTPDTECTRCDGNGWLPRRWSFNSRVQLTEEDCPDCGGHGWRAMTPDEIDDAAADAFSNMCEGEPPVTMQERYEAAWREKRETHHVG